MIARYFYTLFLIIPLLGFSDEPSLKSFVVLNGQKTNSLIWVYHNEVPSKIRLNKKEVYDFLEKIIAPKAVKILDNIKGFKGDLVTFKNLNKTGVKFIFDDQLLDVIINVDAKYIKERKLSLSTKAGRNKATVKPSFFSSYLNARFVQNFASDPITSYERKPLATQLELVNNIGGLAIENTYSSNQFGLRDKKWIRNNTTITYDFQKSMLRAQLGDIAIPAIGFMKSLNGGGLSFQKVFNLNSEFLRGDYFRREIQIDRPGMMEVYVNDVVVHKERVSAGPYTLSNFH